MKQEKKDNTVVPVLTEKELKKLKSQLKKYISSEHSTQRSIVYAGMTQPLLDEFANRVNKGELSKISSGRLVDLIVQLLRELRQELTEPLRSPVKYGKINPIDIEKRPPGSLRLGSVPDLGGAGEAGQDTDDRR